MSRKRCRIKVTTAMVEAANRKCRDDERCAHQWQPDKCEFCRGEAREDLEAAMQARSQEKQS